MMPLFYRIIYILQFYVKVVLDSRISPDDTLSFKCQQLYLIYMYLKIKILAIK